MLTELAVPARDSGRIARKLRQSITQPAILASALCLLLTGIILAASWHAAEHHFVYPLDDAYIGMAIAKNLALHGVWGITPYAFSSADSSILLPLLLAGADRIFGVGTLAPLLFSWLSALATIFVADRTLRRSLNREQRTVALIGLVVLTPLFLGAVLGMEHAVHLLLTLLFLEFFFRPASEPPSPSQLSTLAVVTALMVAARYEGLFFVLPACIVLFLQHRWKPLVLIATSALLPVVAYAAFSIAHGASWLPNSVALKGVQLHGASWMAPLLNAISVLAGNYRDHGLQLFLLLAALALVWILLPRRTQSPAIPVLITLIATALHLCAARIGILFRYEDYLVGSAIVGVAASWPLLAQAGRRKLSAAASLVFFLTAGLLFERSIEAGFLLPACSRSIYLQQWQMARFLHSEFPHSTVAANDIGAIDDFNDIHCFDLVGLANTDVFQARRAGTFTTNFLTEKTAASHVRIAILYDSWFTGKPEDGSPALPPQWIRVGRWTIPHGVVLGDRVVSFYAVDPAEAARLRTDLANFDPTLPAAVEFLPN